MNQEKVKDKLAQIIELPSSSSTTKSNIFSFQYEWTLENFSFYPDKIIKSPSFSSTLDEIGDKWCIQVDPSYCERDQDYTSIHIVLQSINEGLELPVKYEVSILSPKKKVLWTACNSMARIFSMKKYIAGWPNFILRKKLIDPYYGYLNQEKLIIHTKLEIMTDVSIEKPLIDKSIQQLSEDFKKLFNNEKSTDVIFKIKDKSYPANKVILSARSPIFSKMFESDDFKDNQIIINDVENDIFKEILYYIYTNEAPNIQEMALDLLIAADKYQLFNLKNICEDLIIKDIVIENAIETYVFARANNADKLKKRSLAFIKGNFRDVIHTHAFNEMMEKQRAVILELLEVIAAN